MGKNRENGETIGKKMGGDGGKWEKMRKVGKNEEKWGKMREMGKKREERGKQWEDMGEDGESGKNWGKNVRVPTACWNSAGMLG